MLSGYRMFAFTERTFAANAVNKALVAGGNDGSAGRLVPNFEWGRLRNTSPVVNHFCGQAELAKLFDRLHKPTLVRSNLILARHCT